MKSLLIFGVLISAVYANTVELFNAEQIINAVNSANTTWQAGHNFAKDVPLRYIRSLLGVKPSNKSRLPVKSNKHISSSLVPEEFDSRKHWPNCPTVSHIVDQGVCGSCWAVAAASAFSDRLCIATSGKFKLPLSAEELLSCCDECGAGCDGGYPPVAWEFFRDNGVVTGGDYNTTVGCQPYQVEECEHHTTGKRPECSTLPAAPTPECEYSCLNPEYTVDFKRDHHKVKSVYSLGDVEEIQKELMTNGPVEASFTVYSDFPTYKSGVYQHVHGSMLGGHAVRLIGWGTENGTPYWLVANSWNTDWGDKGLFKILRGQNECDFESDICFGEPAV
ncbi:cathepsin B-like [Cimex lectularius]|uniref:Peptidase C1A papain C-terminal domain-containing protein n=1 Tax=Cimex lectularius TaxID=79782 RepID=A0A8I6RLZ0_CIMLE|nr:cathepsin B-like [Cimex lectularius]